MKVLGMTVLALGLAAVSNAQPREDVTPTNIGLRVGVAYPLNDTTRNLTKTLIGVGADVYFTQEWIKGSQTFVSIDWLGKSGSGAKGNIWPVMINQRWYAKNGIEGKRGYFHVGAGIAFVDITSSRSTIAGRLGFGLELGPNIFSEANFVISDNANGAKADSVGIYIGYRF